MNKIISFIIFFIILSSCSLNQNSKFWSASQNIPEEKDSNFKEIFVTEESLEKELNSNLKIKLNNKVNNDLTVRNYFNNDGRLDYDGELKKSSRYKFSKIKNFYQYEPTVSFNKKNLIFFDDKGSIIQFNEKLIKAQSIVHNRPYDTILIDYLKC